jgi:hypothetical protein
MALRASDLVKPFQIAHTWLRVHPSSDEIGSSHNTSSGSPAKARAIVGLLAKLSVVGPFAYS